MKEASHITKSSFSTALISFLVVVALPKDWVIDKSFAAFIAAIPPLLVWAQVVMWKHGREFLEEEMINRFKDRRLTNKIKNVLDDPCIADPEKEKLKQHYSKVKVDSALKLVSDHQSRTEGFDS